MNKIKGSCTICGKYGNLWTTRDICVGCLNKTLSSIGRKYVEKEHDTEKIKRVRTEYQQNYWEKNKDRLQKQRDEHRKMKDDEEKVSTM